MFNPDLMPRSLGWGVYADLAREIEDLGHRFTMLTSGSKSARPDRRREIRALAASPMWQTVGAAAAPFIRTRGLLPAAAGLATYLRGDGRSIDLLHVESAYPHGAAAALAIRASGWLGPLVVTPMGEDTLVLERARYGFRRHPSRGASSRGRCGAQRVCGASLRCSKRGSPISLQTHPVVSCR